MHFSRTGLQIASMGTAACVLVACASPASRTDSSESAAPANASVSSVSTAPADATSTPADSSSAESTPVAASTPLQAASAAQPKAGLRPLGNADTEQKTQRVQAPARLLVTGVRTGTHDGFERVVFDLDGQGEPGWFIDYTETPAQQGSGRPIEYDGATALNVNIDGTILPFEANRPDPNVGTVLGSGSAVKQIVPAGTFEGRSQFVIGLDSRHPYSVQVLNNPTRLVIDILQTH